MPQRIQRHRTKGWRMPDGAVYVGRGTRWGNPYRLGHTQVRLPALTGEAWEHEGRLHKTSGEEHTFVHPDGSVTWHLVQDATAEQCVQLYAEWIGAAPAVHIRQARADAGEFREAVRRELGGRELVCWCPEGAACHADVLWAVANGEVEG